MKVKLFLCSFVLFGMIAASVPAKTAIAPPDDNIMNCSDVIPIMRHSQGYMASIVKSIRKSSDTHQMMVLKYLFEELKKLQLALMVFHSQN
ncbi:MAG: hypothetical protein ACXABF_13120, partial [Candidatus Thorarchaeota archaeon]